MTDPAPSRRSPFALAAALVLVATIVAAAHWPVLRARALSFDDAAFVTTNPLVSHPGWASTRRFFAEVLEPSTVKGYYLPLSMTSLMIDVAMGARPDDLAVFHRTSLALHVVATLLVLLIVERLFGSLVLAAFLALLFGLHPLTVEPVAWIGERKTLLATCFAFASVWTYLEGRQPRRGHGTWLAISVLSFALALLSKPTVILLPLLLLVIDVWPLGRWSARAVIEKWPFALLSIASGIVTWLSHQRTAGIDPLLGDDAARWPVRAGYLLAFYLGRLVRPVDLSCAYPAPRPFALSNPAVLLACGVTVALTTLVIVLARRTRAPLAGWLIFVLAIAPTLGFVQYSWVMASDKYVYFPVLGLLLALGALLSGAAKSATMRPGAMRAVVLVAALALLAVEARGVRAAIRNWADSLTLYRHMADVDPGAPVVQCQLGVELGRHGDAAGAVAHLRRAIELEPRLAEAHYDLGALLAADGRLGDAIEQLRQAEPLMPRDADAPYNLGATLALAGRLDEAEAAFRRAIAIDPRHVQALGHLAGLLAARGRSAEAVEWFRKALALTPEDPSLHNGLGTALLLQGGDVKEAVEHLEHAMRLQPDWAAPVNALAWLLATSPDAGVRNPARALDLARSAVAMTAGNDASALDTMAAAQAAAGDFPAADSSARRALAIASRSGSHAEALVAGIQERLRLYERRTPYRDASGGPAPRR